MRYELRPCTEADRAWAYALKCECYRDVVERQFGPWNEAFQRELFEQRGWKPAISQIVSVDGTAVGLIAVEERDGQLWLQEIQISPAWRGNGIATALIQNLIGRTPNLRLQVLKKNFRAQDLYRRLRFHSVAETETHYILEHDGTKPVESAGPTAPSH